MRVMMMGALALGLTTWPAVVLAPERRAFERALRERLVDVATSEGIELPNHQLDVWMRTNAD